LGTTGPSKKAREKDWPDDRSGIIAWWRRAPIVAAVIAAASFCVYLVTLAPTVLADDSAELVTAAHVLGICHPTGYPLYLLTAKLFDLLPLATPPVRIGLLSAICASAAAGVIAWTTVALTSSAAAGLLAGLVAALNGPMWSKTTEPEVYALNALIISLALMTFLRLSKSHETRGIVALAFITGLGLAHHRTALFFTGPLLVAAALVLRPGRHVLARAVAAGAAPLLFYLYLPIRSAAHPPVMFGDVRGWTDLAPYLTGAAYAQLAFARPLAEVLAVGRQLVGDVTSELTIGGSILALVGVIALLRRSRSLGICLLLSVALLTVWNLGYLVPDWQDFYVPCGLAAGIWVGMGLAALVAAARATVGKGRPRAVQAVSIIVVIFVGASLFQRNWTTSSHRGEWEYYDRATAMLAQMPPGAVYVSDLDHGTFLPMYLQIVEGNRRDIVVAGSNKAYSLWARDPEVIPVIEGLQAEWQPSRSQDPEVRSRDALRFAAALADRLDGSRPVYGWFFLTRPPLDLPATALWSEFYRVAGQRPELLAPDPGGHPVAEYGNGVSLAWVTVTPEAARPRDVLHFSLAWRCSRELPKPPLVLLTLAHLGESGQAYQPPRMLLRYATWLAYGAAPIAPTPPGSVYRQDIVGLAPTNAPPGKWEVRVGVADDLEAHSNAPTRVRPVAGFRVGAAGRQ
jgi:hypothetical protein